MNISNILDKENNNSLVLKFKLTNKKEDLEAEKKEFNYTYISSISSKRRPDVYTKDGVLQARNYRIKNVISENKKENNDSNIEGDNQMQGNSDPEDEFTKVYNEVNKLDSRYFTNNNITIICFNCKEIGHMAKGCPNPKVIMCDRCKEVGHTSYECNNIKCFKCNKIGHRAANCIIEKNFPKCVACKNNGHYSHDCLYKPKEIEKKMMKLEKCWFCNKNGHYICRKSNKIIIAEYEPEDVEISDDTDYENYESTKEANKEISIENSKTSTKDQSKSKKKKPIFSNLSNNLIQFTEFCPKCGDRHKLIECSVKDRQNDFDLRRNQYTSGSNTYFNNKQKKINDFKIYEGNDGFTSDDSFSNVVKKVYSKKSRKDSFNSKDDVKFNNFVDNNTKYKYESYDKPDYIRKEKTYEKDTNYYGYNEYNDYGNNNSYHKNVGYDKYSRYNRYDRNDNQDSYNNNNRYESNTRYY